MISLLFETLVKCFSIGISIHFSSKDMKVKNNVKLFIMCMLGLCNWLLIAKNPKQSQA